MASEKLGVLRNTLCKALDLQCAILWKKKKKTDLAMAESPGDNIIHCHLVGSLP